jgi:hypothetical protein
MSPSNWTPAQALVEQIGELMAEDQARTEEFKKALSGELGKEAWYGVCKGLADALIPFFGELTGGNFGFALAMRCAGENWGACATNMPADAAASTLKQTAKQVKARSQPQ